MFSAYTRLEVTKNVSVVFDCIAGNETQFLAATKNGFLFNFDLTKKSINGQFDLQICKTFAKKGASQLHLLESLKILISLSDGIINVHDTTRVNYSVISTVNKAKGASLFAVDTKEVDGEILLMLAAVVKRKILLFKWNEKEFIEFTQKPEISCPDIPKVVVWCDHSLAVGYRDEYVLIPVQGTEEPGRSEVCHLFNTGSKAIEPLIVKIPSAGLVGFCRDERTVFRNFTGDPVPEYSDILWSDVPLAIECDSPFVVALLGRSCIEVRTLRPSVLVQNIGDLKKCKWISCYSNGQIYAASPNDLWCLTSKSEIIQNIQKLAKDKQFDIAVQLAQKVTAKGNEEQMANKERIAQLKNLWAFHLFCQRKFTEAFALFRDIQKEVVDVIGLFPNLLSDDIRKQIQEEKYPWILTDKFSKTELQDGLQALQSYLSEIRTNIASELDKQSRLKPEESGLRLNEEEISKLKSHLEIVDTTLLQCYLQTNEMLVSSLLRLPDNSCNLEKTERILMEYGKHSELFLLYERRELHQQALELLQLQAKNSNSPLKGLERTVLYLQNLGDKHLDLIFKSAQWVLKEDSQEVLKIFIEDMPEVENLPRDKVMEFLRRECPKLVTPYLEHIIYQWFETRQHFHDILAEHYVLKVKALMTEQMHNMTTASTIPPAGKEPGDLGVWRSKLLYFLTFSQYYKAEIIMVHLPHDSMYEERALMLGKLGQHEKAIYIYTTMLHDYNEAERYCRQNYNPDNKEDRKVFLTLLRMYARPPTDIVIHPAIHIRPTPPPNVSYALKILKSFAPFIDLVKALEYLPESITLNELWMAMEGVLQETTNKRKMVEVNRGLNYSRSLRVRCAKAQAQSVKIVIDQDTVCDQCAKKIGNSAFARTPDGSLLHYFCYHSKDSGRI